MTSIPGNGLLNTLPGAAGAPTNHQNHPTRPDAVRTSLHAQSQHDEIARSRADARPVSQPSAGEPLRRDIPRGTFIDIVV